MPSHTGAGGANAPTKAQIQSSELVYADATGSGGNFAVTLSPAVAAYTDGIIIAFSANHARSWDYILRELTKCVVRCANCHRKRTATQFGYGKLKYQNRLRQS